MDNNISSTTTPAKRNWFKGSAGLFLIATASVLAMPAISRGEATLPLASVTAPSEPAAANTAPDWQLKDLAGNPVKLSDYRGKVVILDFWATWCPPCRAEIPGFVALQDKYRSQGLVVIGVAMDDSDSSVVQSFAKAHHMNYPVVMGNEDVANQYGGLEGVPTTFVIDPQGKIVSQHIGYTDSTTFEQEIQKHLPAPATAKPGTVDK